MASPSDSPQPGRRGAGPIPDLMFVIGLALIGYGLWRIYPPLVYIFAGVILAAGGYLLHRSGR